MNKEDFLDELTFYLHKMDKEERNKFITFYDEMIADYVENGMSEEAAVAKIGNPENIAKDLLGSNDNVEVNLPSTGNKVLNYVLLIMGFPLWGSLLLTVILLVLSAYMIIWCLPIITGASCAGFFISSIIGIIGTPLVLAHSTSTGIIQLGAGVASIGIAFILGFLTISLSNKLVVTTKTLNKKLIVLFKKKVVIR